MKTTMLNNRAINKIRVSIQDFFSNFNLERVVIFIVFLLGLIFIFAIPPFQKPDENVHFLRSVALSEGQFYCYKEDMGISYFNIPEKYLNFISDSELYRIAFHPEEKFYGIHLNDQKYLDLEKDVKFEGYCSLPFFSYIPISFEILLGEILNSILVSFYLARIVPFLFFMLALVWSYNKIINSRYRIVLLIYALIPMVLHQATAISYDYVQLSISPILFSYLIYFLKTKTLTRRDILLFCIYLLVLLVAKPGYYFLSLLFFLIPKSKTLLNKKSYMFISIFFFSLVLLILLEYLLLINTNQGVSVVTNIEPSAQLKLLMDPVYSLILLKNTLSVNSEFYYKSFFGMFGWLDYSLSSLFYLMILPILGIFSFYLSKEKFPEENINKTFTIVGSSLLLSTIFISITFYLSTNEIGSWIIVGLQGRYFLMFFPFIILIASLFLKILFKKNLIMRLFILLFLLYLMIEIIYAILSRYYI